jgi:sensor histidine kinase YesM
VEARPQATLITVTAEVREAMVSVEVRDTPDLSPVATTAGRATPPPSAALPAAGDEGGDGGIGLSNTRARLELLFGDRYDLRLTRSEGGSTSVHLAWPAGGAALPIAR